MRYAGGPYRSTCLLRTHHRSKAIRTALAKKRDDEMYKGSEVEMVRSTPVAIGAVIPASRDRADAMPVAVPRCATGNRRGVYPSAEERQTV